MESLALNGLFGGIYSGRKVLVTGHTGFKGTWLVASFALSIWLAIQARGVDNEAAIILFGVRAVSAPLLALVHLRWVADALRP